MNSFKRGILAEYLVWIFYKLQFYTILKHRMKTYVGEIDLIVLRSKTVVFIEVKARKYGICEGVVSNAQIQRIKRAASLFLTKNPAYAGYNIRFDLVVITPYKWPVVIQNAW